MGYSEVSKLVNRTPNACRARLYHIRKETGQFIRESNFYYPKWTEEEEQFLKENYPDKGAVWCAEKLKRTEKACITRAVGLKIKRSYRWKPEDDEVIRKYYPKYGVKKVSEILGRTRETCSTRAYVLGIKYIDENRWTKEEIDFIKKNYPEKGVKYVSEKLNRSIVACQNKAAILKLRRPPKWTKEEKEFIEKYYPEKGAVWCGKKLNKSPSKCTLYARRHNIKYINLCLWTEEEIKLLKKYYPILGKYACEMIPNKDKDSCTRAAHRLKISYTKNNSAAVEKIKKYLDKQKIIYKEEVGLEGCINKQQLLFDFAIYKDKELKEIIGLIEYDGSQHFLPTTLYSDRSITANEVLERTQKRDQIKNKYCQKNNIPLLRIKYCQDNIEKLIETFLKYPQSFIKWYNPELTFKEYYADLDDQKLKAYYIHFSKYRKKSKKNNHPNFCISKWTNEDDLFLEKYYPDKGSIWVSKKLHRSSSSCKNRAHLLGLYRSNHWKKKEDAMILKYYFTKGPKWISTKTDRTYSAILHRAHKLGLKKDMKYWTKEEDEVIIKYYGIKNTTEIAKLVGRSKMSVDNRCRILRTQEAQKCYTNENDVINVISVQEPVASIIKCNSTLMITRKTNTNYKGILYIHSASKRIGQKGRLKYKKELKKYNLNKFKYSHIIAKCNLIKCIKINSQIMKDNSYIKKMYGEIKLGRYIWVLEDIEPLETPMFAKGNTSIWKYKKENEKVDY